MSVNSSGDLITPYGMAEIYGWDPLLNVVSSETHSLCVRHFVAGQFVAEIGVRNCSQPTDRQDILGIHVGYESTRSRLRDSPICS